MACSANLSRRDSEAERRRDAWLERKRHAQLGSSVSRAHDEDMRAAERSQRMTRWSDLGSKQCETWAPVIAHWGSVF